MGWQGLGSKTEDFLVDEHTADDVPSSGYVDDMDEWTSWFDTEWDVYAASASIKKLDEAETCAAGAVSTSQFSGADTGSGSQATVAEATVQLTDEFATLAVETSTLGPTVLEDSTPSVYRQLQATAHLELARAPRSPCLRVHLTNNSIRRGRQQEKFSGTRRWSRL